MMKYKLRNADFIMTEDEFSTTYAAEITLYLRAILLTTILSLSINF